MLILYRKYNLIKNKNLSGKRYLLIIISNNKLTEFRLKQPNSRLEKSSLQRSLVVVSSLVTITAHTATATVITTATL